MQLLLFFISWAEVIRRVCLWVEIEELNEQGVYVPVEVQQSQDVITGGVYQLKQVFVLYYGRYHDLLP